MKILYSSKELTDSREDKLFVFKLVNGNDNKSFKDAVDTSLTIVNVIDVETEDNDGNPQKLLALVTTEGQIYIGKSDTIRKDIMKAISALGDPTDEYPIKAIIRCGTSNKGREFNYLDFI